MRASTLVLLLVGMAGCSNSNPRSTPSIDLSTSDAATAPDAAYSYAAFNAFFVTEWGPTAYNAAGTEDGYNDCGPSSLVMLASARGKIPAPTSATAEAAIRSMRVLAHGGPTPKSLATYGPMMLTALDALELAATDLHLSIMPSSLDDDLDAIEKAISDEGTVLIAGDPGNAWGRALDAQHAYLHQYDVVPADDSFGHWVIVFGKAPSGMYVLGDPLSMIGVVEVTALQLRTYFADGKTLSGAIEVDPPSN